MVTTAVLQSRHPLLTDIDHHDASRFGIADRRHPTTALATTARLDLGEVDSARLATLDDACIAVTCAAPAAFDADCCEAQQLSLQLTFRFDENTDPTGRRVVTVNLTSTQRPAADRPAAATGSHPLQPGDRLGEPLTDDVHRPDGYRFHDAIYLGSFTALSWVANLQALLGRKRESHPIVDEGEGNARATFTEDGLAAVRARLAEPRVRFRRYHAVTRHIVDSVRAATAGYEVAPAPGWPWCQVICFGLRMMYQLAFMAADC